MTKSLPTVVFFGNERLATGVSTSTPTLKGLINAGFPVKAVVTSQADRTSRRNRRLEIAELASEHKIPVLKPVQPRDIIDQLKAFGADIGVLVAYGKIIPQDVIDLFPNGIVNVHPSLLPLHRGPTPIESIILSGETETGISIMQLAKAMDAGPVYGFSCVSLSGNESKQELADIMSELGSQSLIELLPGIVSGEIIAQPQSSEPTYDQLISKQDGIIDWAKPAVQIAREVRAYLGWPGSRTKIGAIEVIVTEVSIEESRSKTPGSIFLTKDSLVVDCSEDAISVKRLKPAGKSEMSVVDFVSGYRKSIEITD